MEIFLTWTLPVCFSCVCGRAGCLLVLRYVFAHANIPAGGLYRLEQVSVLLYLEYSWKKSFIRLVCRLNIYTEPFRSNTSGGGEDSVWNLKVVQ